MRFALDKDGKRVHIDATHAKENYFCPECGAKLVLRKGNIRTHHFAHQANSQCTDSWHYDMSDWHMRWQARFPLETQEVVKTYNGQKHRADVLDEGSKLVFEFQHSALSSDEFDDRNRFYNGLGYKVIWIFDLTDQYEGGCLDEYKDNLFRWSRPKKALDNFIPRKNPQVELYFQIQLSAAENERIQSLKGLFEAGHGRLPESELYYSRHKNDNTTLLKVIWAPESGFERFMTDELAYDETDMVGRISKSNKTIEKTKPLGEMADRLIEMYTRDHSTYYFGCPISPTHLSAHPFIDLSESKQGDIRPCMDCQFAIFGPDGSPRCKKRFVDLGLPLDTEVEILGQDRNGFVNKLVYSDEKGTNVAVLPSFESPLIKSIFELWQERSCQRAIFKNIRTGKFVKIVKDPNFQMSQYRRVKGFLSNEQYSFGTKWLEIFGCSNPEWICVWSI